MALEGETPSPPAVDPKPSEDRWAKWDKRIRDLFLWVVSGAALVNELFLVKPEPRTGVLVFVIGVFGVPFVLKADERRNR